MKREYDRLPPELAAKLRQSLRRVKTVLLMRGGLAVAAIALTALMVAMAIDATGTIYTAIGRWSLFGLVLVATAAAFGRYLWRPLFLRLTLRDIASLVDRHHPEWEERLSSTVELMFDESSPDLLGSQQLIDELTKEAIADAWKLSPRLEFSLKSAKPVIVASGILVATLVLLVTFWPAEMALLLTRTLVPFADVGNAQSAKLYLRPGDCVVPKGAPLRVEAKVTRAGIQRATLQLVSADGAESAERMTLLSQPDDLLSSFSLRFPAVTNSFRYRIRIGRAMSAYYQVEAIDRPDIDKLTIAYAYPEYTGLAPMTETTKGKDIAAVAGTSVTLGLTANKPLAEKELVASSPLETLIQTLREEPRTVTWTFPLEKGLRGTWGVKLLDGHGFTNAPASYGVEALEDQTPVVQLTEPVERKLRVKPTEGIPLSYIVSEDFGIAAADVVLELGPKKKITVKLDAPLRLEDKREMWAGAGVLELGKVDLGNIRRIKARVRIGDTLPEQMEGPQYGLSEPITIEIDRSAKSLLAQGFEEQEKTVRDALRDAKEHADKALQKAAHKDEQVAKKQEIESWRRKELEEVGHQMASAQAKLNELADQVENTAFDRLSEPLREISEQHMEEARRAAESVPLTDDLQQREAEAQKMEQQAHEAVDGLNDMMRKAREAAQDAHKMARVADLAQREDHLADQMAVNEQANAQDVPSAWRQQQNQLAREVGQLLRNEPEALRQQLNADGQEASALAKDASELGQASQELTQNNPANTEQTAQEALRNDLVNELQRRQQELASDAREFAGSDAVQSEPASKQAQQAAGEAAQSAQQLSQGDIGQAAQSAESAGEELRNTQQGLETGQPSAGEQPAESGQQAEQTGAQQGEQPGAQQGEQPGAQQGEQAGAQQGQQTGAQQGEQAGAQQGQQTGAQQGEQAGAQQGEQAGAQQGEQAGAQQGEQAGAQQGQQAGAQQGEQAGAQQGESGNPELAAQAGDLAARQERLAEEMQAVESDDLAGAMGMMTEDMAAQAESLLGQAEALASRQESLGLPPPGGQPQRGAQGQPASSQPASPGQSLGVPESMQSMAGQMSALADQLAAQAGQAGQGTPSQSGMPLNPQALGESFEQSSAAAGAPAPGPAASSAQQAAEALQSLAQATAQQMGMVPSPGSLPGMNPGQMPGMMPGQMPGQPGSQPSSMPSIGEGGMRRTIEVVDGMPEALRKLGMTKADWTRLTGNLKDDVVDVGSEDVPPEYRAIIKRYFRELAKRGTADENAKNR